MQRRMLRGFVSIFSGKLSSYLLTLLITPLLVRLLGSKGYGQYAVVLSIISLSMIVVDAGSFDGVRKYIAEDSEKQNRNTGIFGFYFRLNTAILFSSIVTLVVAGLSGFGTRLFGQSFGQYFILISFILVGRQGFRLCRGALLALGDDRLSEPLPILERLVFTIVAAVLVLAGWGVLGALFALLTSALITAAVGFVLVSRRINLWSALWSDIGMPRRTIIGFNFFSVLLTLLTASLYNIDILLLGYLGEPAQTGYYKSALTIVELLWFIPQTLQTLLLHSTSELWSEGATERVTKLSSRASRYTLTITVLLALGLAALADDLLPIYYGAEFSAAVTPLLLLIPGTIGFALARPIFAIGQGKGALRALVITTAAASAINLGLNIILIPDYGMYGAAVATSIGYGLMFIFHTITARYIGFDPISDLRAPRIGVCAGLAAIAIFGVDSVISSPIVSLLFVPPVGFAVYSWVGIILGVVDRAEIDFFLSQVPLDTSRFGKS